MSQCETHDLVSIDILMPGSANDHFFSNIAFARMGLDALGGVFANARLVAVLGEWEEPRLPERWCKHFERIDVVWANENRSPNPTFAAQHFERFDNIRADADVAIICDADVCFLRRFSGLLIDVIQQDFVGGVMAHYHFPVGGERGDPDADWQKLSKSVLGRTISLDHRYLFGRDPNEFPEFDPYKRPKAPFYINYGFLIGKPHRLQQLALRERELTPEVEKLVEPYFAAQVSLALASADLDFDVRALPARYNFPNRPEARLLQPGELSEVVLLHYMYEENFRRSRLFAQQKEFDAFLTKKVIGPDKVFQSHIKNVTSAVYPFA